MYCQKPADFALQKQKQKSKRELHSPELKPHRTSRVAQTATISNVGNFNAWDMVLWISLSNRLQQPPIIKTFWNPSFWLKLLMLRSKFFLLNHQLSFPTTTYIRVLFRARPTIYQFEIHITKPFKQRLPSNLYHYSIVYAHTMVSMGQDTYSRLGPVKPTKNRRRNMWQPKLKWHGICLSSWYRCLIPSPIILPKSSFIVSWKNGLKWIPTFKLSHIFLCPWPDDW